MKKLTPFLLLLIFACSKEETAIEEDYTTCEPSIVSPENAKADIETGLIEFDIIPDRQGKGAAVKDKLWPKGVIPYYFEDDDRWTEDGENFVRLGYEGAKRDTVRKALTELSAKTGLQFVEYDNKYKLLAQHDNGIYIQAHFQNSSHVGSQGGMQILNLSPEPEISTVKHEFLHAAGILHEATRSDRDEHIVIHYDNIPERQHRQFDKYEGQDVFTGYDCGNFDFESIMLYPSFRSYGIDENKPTITDLDGETWERNTELSQGDIRTIQALYKNEFKKRNHEEFYH